MTQEPWNIYCVVGLHIAVRESAGMCQNRQFVLIQLTGDGIQMCGDVHLITEYPVGCDRVFSDKTLTILLA